MQVSADGPQTRDISLPWDNSQIDAARRTFLDRHPLAKNKEQVALAKGEGMLLSEDCRMMHTVCLFTNTEAADLMQTVVMDRVQLAVW